MSIIQKKNIKFCVTSHFINNVILFAVENMLKQDQNPGESYKWDSRALCGHISQYVTKKSEFGFRSTRTKKVVQMLNYTRH